MRKIRVLFLFRFHSVHDTPKVIKYLVTLIHINHFNQCSTSIPPENLWFSDVFRGYRSGKLVENGFILISIGAP